MKRIALLIVISGLAAVMWGAAMPCAAPPFAAKVVRPNIILMFDNSGSMGDEPHTVTSITVGTANDTFSWYGYFNPKRRYSYASNRFFEDVAGPYPGNILNWITMSRGDVLRKVLTGGRASSTGGGIATLRTEGRFGRWYTYRVDASNYTTFYMDHDVTSMGRLDVSWTGAAAPIKQTANDMRVQVEIPIALYRGVIHQIGDEDVDDQWDPDAPAFGLWFFHTNNPTPEAGFVMDYIGDPTVTLSQFSNHIRNEPFATNTPHAETYFEITHYVSQSDPHYQMGDYTKNPGGNKDPYWDQRLADTLWCARTFVICMTDGESTLDANVPNNDGHVPACNNLLTMGRPYTQNNGYYFDEVAYYAHITDLRQTGYRPLQDMQEITLFTIYTFSTGVVGDSLLNLAAKVGGFVDKNGNRVPDLASEWDEDHNGQADNYFRATNGQQLEAAILKAISMIMARVASGSPTAVVSSGARSEGLVYQSLFWPRKFEGTDMIDWSGRMHSLWIDRYGYMHEDTDLDKILSVKNDNIVKMDTTIGMAELWRDTSGRGIDSLLRYMGTVHIDNLKHVWNGAKMLHLRSPATREIYTWVDKNMDGIVDHPGEYIAFDVGNEPDIRAHLDVANNPDTALALIRYIRGQDILGHRNRTVLGNVWKLGDIIYSANTYVGKPQEGYSLIYYDVTYRNFYNKYKLATPPVIADSSRADAIYVGANDGMLHCFNAGKFVSYTRPVSDTTPGYLHWWGTDEPGKELWAYIPFNLLPHLKWLWDNNYCHVYYVDLKPYVTDVKIFAPDNVHRDGWGTMLISGMRLGGTPITVGAQTYRSAYFAFDVTKAKDAANNLPKLLWEFTDPQLRYTTCYPVVVKVKNSWFLVFGSGPATLSGTAASATAQLYVLDLFTGQLRRKFSLPAGDSIVGDITAVDVGLNYSNELIYFGTYNSRGGAGKLYRISTKGLGSEEDEDPANWLLSVVIDAVRPVVGAPGITLDYRNNLWVYFGTGRYYNALDEADLTEQRFYGIKDDGSLIIPAQLLDVTDVIIKGDSAYGLGGPIAYDSLMRLVEVRKGWYRNFTTGGVGQGERCWTKPLVIGGAVVFTTGTPSGGDLCLFGGTGDLYALFYLTGAAYKKAILGKNMAGEHLVKVSLGSGIPAGAGLYIGSDREKAFIQSATGGIRGIQMRLPFSPREGVQVYKRR